MKALKKTATGIAVLLLFLMVAAGCNKDTDCKGVITVLDSAGQPVAGATVKLSSGDMTDQQTTDASGKSHHVLKLPAILDIYVNGSPTGKVIRLQAGETAEVTVQ
jgi:hypothetical protein